MTVIAQFFGVCTHIGLVEFVELAEEGFGDHRVVLVNASDQARIDSIPKLRQHHVNAHVARLQLKAADMLELPPPAAPWFPITYWDTVTVQWALNGVHLSIGNAVSNPTEIPMQCIPHLSHFAKPLPALGPATTGDDPVLTACHFDFPTSEFTGRRIGLGAAVGVLTVATIENEVPTSIIVRQFGTQETITIPIREGTEISVSNNPLDGTVEKDADFLLHFLATVEVPENATFPTRPPCPEPLHTYNPPLGGPDVTGPGCSNSTYP